MVKYTIAVELNNTGWVFANSSGSPNVSMTEPKSVIKKLKKGKKYNVKVTYLKDTIKTTVKVKK